MQRSPSRGKQSVLVVGAGPVGLAAALFMSSNPNVNVDIIQKSKQPRNMIESKALLINARTMALLQNYPLQKKLISQSIKVTKMTFGSPTMTSFEFNPVEMLEGKTPYPNNYIYPQHYTERVLEEGLLELGIKVRKGVSLEKLNNSEAGVLVKLSDMASQKVYDVVLGADGARSTVRKQMGIKFEGSEINTMMQVADFELETEWRSARVVIGNPETVLFLPVRGNLIRIVTNFKDYEEYVSKVGGIKLGRKVWESEFKIRNLHAETMNIGNVYLAGDSAHIHAPLGGRGMNLGIEDAYVFANLLREDRLREYNSFRLPVVQQFVGRIEKASKMLMENEPSLTKRMLPWMARIGFYFMRDSAIQFMNGLDHSIPFLAPKM